MYNGILCLKKPRGFTSHDAVAKLRGMLRQRRIGHAGTLDPQAEGVLVVLLGAATKASDDASGQDKTYLAGLRLGTVTDTQDIWGNVLEARPASVTPEQLEAALAAFRGEILQIPPMVSAVQIGGQRLYKLARQGVEIERPARKVYISQLEILSPPALVDSPIHIPENDIALRVTGSKGTYIRTLCHDIGAALGCGGCMSALTRIRSGDFDWRCALSMEEVQSLHTQDRLADRLLPTDRIYAALPAVTLNAEGSRRAVHGNTLESRHMAQGQAPSEEALCRVYLDSGVFYMLGVGKSGGTVACHKTFGVGA